MTVGRILALLACLVALALAGCASKLDTDKIEVELKRGLADRTGARVASVTCPDDVDAKKGDAFRCTARTARGEQVALRVVQQDDEGSVTWRIVQQP